MYIQFEIEPRLLKQYQFKSQSNPKTKPPNQINQRNVGLNLYDLNLKVNPIVNLNL